MGIDVDDQRRVGAALYEMPGIDDVLRKDRSEYRSLLSQLQREQQMRPIEMKMVHASVRQYVVPLVANDLVARCRGAAILLVDDLCSTGSSLRVAAAAMGKAQPRAIRALCLLSSVS